MKLVFLLEEPSMQEVLKILLPQILPPAVEFKIVPHQGKGDLKKSIPVKLRNWNEPQVHFIVVQDQDSSDCKEVKADLKKLCAEAGRQDTLIRIACHELEAWYFGDLVAVEQAYNINLKNIKNKAAYRVADNIPDPKNALNKILKGRGHQQVSGAKRIAKFMDIDKNTSTSFNFFISGVRKMAGL